MARLIESWFICDGRYRIHSVKPVGAHPEQIIEIEDVDNCKRFHGSGADLERLGFSLVSGRGRPKSQGQRDPEDKRLTESLMLSVALGKCSRIPDRETS